MGDKKRFGEAMVVLAVATGHELTEQILRVYWAELEHYEPDDVDAALRHLGRTSKFFPRLAEIIDLLKPDDVSVEDQARAAWDDVMPLLRNSRAAVSNDPITEAVINQMGGYVRLGMLETDKLVWERKDFEERYVRALETGEAPIHRSGITGTARAGDMLANVEKLIGKET